MDLERKHARLRSRFEKQRDALVNSELEKTDLKDSVLQLVEKGPLSYIRTPVLDYTLSSGAVE
jgi:hypothetical protein